MLDSMRTMWAGQPSPTPTQPTPQQGELFSRPTYQHSSARAASAGAPGLVPALQMARSNRQRFDGDGTPAEQQPDSARRRAASARAAANSLGGGVGTPFEDPSTARFNYEQVASARASLNPVCKELYLTEDDFQRIFGMDKKSFYSMRLWKQRDIKKRVGLF